MQFRPVGRIGVARAVAMRHKATVLGILFLLVTCPAVADTITVSGHITDPGGAAVPGVEMSVITFGGQGALTTTDAAGYYSVVVSSGAILIQLKPPRETRLAQYNGWIGEYSASFTWDFALLAGTLISGMAEMPDGSSLGGRVLEIYPLARIQPDGEWYYAITDPENGAFEAVVPFDVYWMRVSPPSPYYAVNQPVDGSTGDVSGVVLTVTDELSTPYPEDPPDRSKITVGEIDGLGEALVTGAAGAVDPYVHVLVINLDSLHQAHAVSAADGSFSTRVFAPPGSALLVKHGAMPMERWREVAVGVSFQFSPFPGTIIELPHTHQAGDERIPFAAVGAVDYRIDFLAETVNWVNAAWVIAGEFGPSRSLSAGDGIRIEGTIRVFSPAIDTTTDLEGLSVDADLDLLQLYAGDGRAVGPGGFMSSRMTPTGFPIQDDGLPFQGIEGAGFTISDFTLVGENSIEGTFVVDAQLPADLRDGTYRPFFACRFTGFPASEEWVAAEVYSGWFEPTQAELPPIFIGVEAPEPPRMAWHLLLDDPVQGIRGAGAMEDREHFGFSHRIATQGSPYVIPPVDQRTGRPITYRLEPYMPRISFTDRRISSRPVIPFAYPGGMLNVVVEPPDGPPRDLGSAPIAQSVVGTRTAANGDDLNPGTTQFNDFFSLTTGEESFELTFDSWGRHFVIMNGLMEDIWGNPYVSEGVYEVWVAEVLDIDPGVLPSVPLAVGDAFNPAVRLSPGVPAEVTITVTLFPESDPSAAIVQTVSGTANQYGRFSSDDSPITMDYPGEYRVDMVATYTADSGEMYMGAMNWGSIVMTPPAEAELIAHGRRGLDSMEYIPGSWFVSSRDLTIPAGGVSHFYNSYYNGDMLWTRISDIDWGGDSLLLVATLQDLVGTTAEDIRDRAVTMGIEVAPPGTLSERFQAGELPVFSSTTSGLSPLAAPDDVDQIAYSYRSSQRPGVRVRELVSGEIFKPDYWRLDTQYDKQFGVGLLGDQANDFKFQYVGVVFRDIPSGRNEYLGQGSGRIFIPEDDVLGSRSMPPFAGQGNGGWTTEGGPILTLQDQDIDLFILPTGTRPGAMLEVGDTFHFAGHIMPTLASDVSVTLTSPRGTQYTLGGQANSVGYYYNPGDNVIVDESGAWAVDVRVWHDGQCSGGATVPPYPQGDVLGSDNGRYWIYVVDPDQPRIEINAPSPGYFSIGDTVQPVTIEGRVPANFDTAVVEYTISMPGYILEQGEVEPVDGRFEIVYDPVALHQEFPNIDLIGRDDRRPGLSDTIVISMLMTWESGPVTVSRANTVTIQGQRIFVGGDGRGFRDVRAPRQSGGRVTP